jgi:amino acid transporter
MVGVGAYRVITHAPINHIIPLTQHVPVTQPLTLFLILRAFASGCVAMTGTEAVANGIPAFKPPESRNAATTLTYMAAILGSLFIGLTFLAHFYRVLPTEHETVVSQIARGVFGRGWFYFLVQYATAAILILAANTAFQDFPRLSSILARDRFAPRQLANIGDKLVFSNGIVALAAVAMGLIALFHGDTHALIPLYAVGVFVCFTLSQAGMVVRHRRLREKGWKSHAVINSIGAFATGVVSLVLAVMKFTHGAWMVVILIPILVFIFHKIHQHYVELAEQLRVTKFEEPPQIRSTAIVLVASVHKGILPAVEYARTLSHDCRALYIEIDPNDTPLIRDRWEQFHIRVPLVILESPYRSVIGPTLDYLEEAKKERPNYVVTVVLPEFVPRKWWHTLLHNKTALFLKIYLMLRRDIVVTNVRYFLDR